MSISICGAPCCWGVEGLENPDMPVWQTVLGEAHQAGFRALELGPYGYLSLDAAVTSAALEENGVDYQYFECAHSGHGLQNDNAVYRQWMETVEAYLDKYMPVACDRMDS